RLQRHAKSLGVEQEVRSAGDEAMKKLVIEIHPMEFGWCATYPSYDYAPDSNCQMGYGPSPEDAAVDLIELGKVEFEE
ncbi:MAG: hypothetical protein EBZ53_04990, partial [Verrucomicrobia bacterium]|nr:hypothetical protein [Verrucomicrobiota bacterium]